MPVRVESIANLKWLILVFYNAAFNDPNAVQNLRSRGGADLNEDLICGNLKKQLVLCYAKPHPPSPTNKSFSFLSSSTFPSWSSSCSSVGRARRFLLSSGAASSAGAAGAGMQSSSAGALGTGMASAWASSTVSKKDIWRGRVESSGWVLGWLDSAFSSPFKVVFGGLHWDARLLARSVCVCARPNAGSLPRPPCLP